jgi:hypothetical protein
MKVADVRGKPDDGLAVHLDHKAKHTMGRRMLRAHIDDHRLIFCRLVPTVARGVGDDVFNARIECRGAG